LLIQAKALRNENNYEALLIAHEFNHVHMSDLFTQFTLEMCEGARRSLRTTAQLFDQYLTASSGLPSGARLFIAQYVERRVLAPVRAWYGDTVARELGDLLSPLRVDPILPYSREVEEINSAVDFAIFDPKAGLMNDFRGKVRMLGHLVRRDA
jgi:aspartate aminotransferase-like enzyme